MKTLINYLVKINSLMFLGSTLFMAGCHSGLDKNHFVETDDPSSRRTTHSVRDEAHINKVWSARTDQAVIDSCENPYENKEAILIAHIQTRLTQPEELQRQFDRLIGEFFEKNVSLDIKNQLKKELKETVKSATTRYKEFLATKRSTKQRRAARAATKVFVENSKLFLKNLERLPENILKNFIKYQSELTELKNLREELQKNADEKPGFSILDEQEKAYQQKVSVLEGGLLDLYTLDVRIEEIETKKDKFKEAEQAFFQAMNDIEKSPGKKKRRFTF